MSWELGRGKGRSIKSALYGEAASGAWFYAGPWQTVSILPESYLNWGTRRLWLVRTNSSFFIGGCLWGNQLPRTFNLPPRPQENFCSQKKKSPQAESAQMPQYRCPSLLEYRWMPKRVWAGWALRASAAQLQHPTDHPSTNSSFSGQRDSDVIKDKSTQVPLLKK